MSGAVLDRKGVRQARKAELELIETKPLRELKQMEDAKLVTGYLFVVVLCVDVDHGVGEYRSSWVVMDFKNSFVATPPSSYCCL